MQGLQDLTATYGSTMMVIFAAVACEHARQLDTSIDIIRAFSARLPSLSRKIHTFRCMGSCPNWMRPSTNPGRMPAVNAPPYGRVR
jgi:hypothetical protein